MLKFFKNLLFRIVTDYLIILIAIFIGSFYLYYGTYINKNTTELKEYYDAVCTKEVLSVDRSRTPQEFLFYLSDVNYFNNKASSAQDFYEYYPKIVDGHMILHESFYTVGNVNNPVTTEYTKYEQIVDPSKITNFDLYIYKYDKAEPITLKEAMSLTFGKLDSNTYKRAYKELKLEGVNLDYPEISKDSKYYYVLNHECIDANMLLSIKDDPVKGDFTFIDFVK